MKKSLSVIITIAALAFGSNRAHAVVSCQVAIVNYSDGTECVGWKCSNGDRGLDCGPLASAKLIQFNSRSTPSESELANLSELSFKVKPLSLKWSEPASIKHESTSSAPLSK